MVITRLTVLKKKLPLQLFTMQTQLRHGARPVWHCILNEIGNKFPQPIRVAVFSGGHLTTQGLELGHAACLNNANMQLIAFFIRYRNFQTALSDERMHWGKPGYDDLYIY